MILCTVGNNVCFLRFKADKLGVFEVLPLVQAALPCLSEKEF